MPFIRRLKSINKHQTLRRKYREERLAEEYLKDFNPVAAMIRVGYAKNTACRNSQAYMRREGVQKRLKVIMDEAKQRNALNVDEVISGLRDNIKSAALDGKYSDVNRALELLGKYLGMFNDKTTTDINLNPFSSGTDPQQMADDVARLLLVASPKVKNVQAAAEPKPE